MERHVACRRCHARKVRCDARLGYPCSGCRSSGTLCLAHEKRRRNRGPPRPDTLPPLLPAMTERAPALRHARLEESSTRLEVQEADRMAAATLSTLGEAIETVEVVEVGDSVMSDNLGLPASASEPASTSGSASTSASASAINAVSAPASVSVSTATSARASSISVAAPTSSSVCASIAASTSPAKPATTATTATTNAPDAKRHLVEMLAQEDIESRVMQKGVRIVYVGQPYSNIHYLVRQRAQNESVHHFPTNAIGRRWTAHELDRIPREAFELPAPAVVDELLAAYFAHVHPGFPVLDEEVFMAQYRSRDPSNPPSLLVLQAVLMVGAHVIERRPRGLSSSSGSSSSPSEHNNDNNKTNNNGDWPDSERAELKAGFFRRAKMLFDARFEGNRDVVVQAALLLTWHSEGVEDIGANAYFWVGMAARTALGLGMHRDAGASTLVASDKRLWRRLWWVLVQFDVIVALSYGRPPALPPPLGDACDVPLPVPEDFGGSGSADTVDSAYFVHHTHLCCIISQTLRDRFGLHVPPARRRAALLEADRRLADWSAGLPPELRGSGDGGHGGHGSGRPWVHMLHVTYNNFLLLLHRPPPTPSSSAGAPPGQDDMGICSAAAAALVGRFEAVTARGELRLLNVFAVDAIFTALIQLSAEIRVANPVLATHALARFDIAMDVLRRLARHWLHAEIVLRVFEDSSERMRRELVIGRAAPALMPGPTSTPGQGPGSGLGLNPDAVTAEDNIEDTNHDISSTDTTFSTTPSAHYIGPHTHNLPQHHHHSQQPQHSQSAQHPQRQHHSHHHHHHQYQQQHPLPLPMDSWQSLLMSPGSLPPGLGPLNDQLEWANLYWENAGYASLSPFDMRMGVNTFD